MFCLLRWWRQLSWWCSVTQKLKRPLSLWNEPLIFSKPSSIGCWLLGQSNMYMSTSVVLRQCSLSTMSGSHEHDKSSMKYSHKHHRHPVLPGGVFCVQHLNNRLWGNQAGFAPKWNLYGRTEDPHSVIAISERCGRLWMEMLYQRLLAWSPLVAKAAVE